MTTSHEQTAASTATTTMSWTLEVVVVPVADIDRATSFYADQLGFAVDHDTTVGPGSGWCS